MPARVALLTALAALLVAAPEASAAFTVRTNGDGWITKIGSLTTRSQPPTLGRAVTAFGRPTEVEPVGNGPEACRVVWGPLKLRALFANFGGARACGPGEGLLQTATIRSRRFRTSRGVRVGDRSSTIKEKHPNAEFHGRTWWIASAASPFGEEATEIPTVEAIVAGGRVTILRLWIGGAGD
jgi:hypothetical protein